MTQSVGLVVPAYRPDVDRLVPYVQDLAETIEPDVIRIELDDPRGAVVEHLSGLPAAVNSSPERRGKGAAITDGFESLDTDVLAFADADGATPAAEFQSVVDPVVEGDADLAVGSRRHPDAEVATHQTPTRRHLGDAFAWVARRFLAVGLHDYQCGAKAISAEGWAAVREHLYEPGFAWDVELIAMAGAVNLRVQEVPVEWYDKPGSTVSPVETSLELGQALFAARHRSKRIREGHLHTVLDSGREDRAALVDQQ